jgi:hypothetical protein
MNINKKTPMSMKKSIYIGDERRGRVFGKWYHGKSKLCGVGAGGRKG